MKLNVCAVFAAGLMLIAADAAQAKSVTYAFNFDGFCDGMVVTVTGGKQAIGYSTGCFAGGVETGIVAKTNVIAGVTSGPSTVLVLSSTNFGAGSATTYVINLTAGTWIDYVSSDGKTDYHTASGTITMVTPPAAKPAITGAE